jgi:hypothetical protein
MSWGRIVYPTRKIHCVNVTAKGESFVAHGVCSKDLAAVSARLVTSDGAVTINGVVLRNPPHWAFIFGGLTIGARYSLELRDPASGDVLHVRKKLRAVSGPKEALTITFPGPGQTVGSNFYAYGDTTETGQVVGRLYLDTAVAETGAERQRGPGMWVVEFANVVEDTYDRLEVTAGASVSNSADISIAAALGGS